MAYRTDLANSARRHLKAAEALNGLAAPGAQPGCQAVAGYLFGLSGELAVKAMMQDSGMSPLTPEQRRDDPFYAHFPDLKSRLLDHAKGRRSGELRAIAEKRIAFFRTGIRTCGMLPRETYWRSGSPNGDPRRTSWCPGWMRFNVCPSVRRISAAIGADVKRFGRPDFVARGTVLRDASGRLTFVSDRAPKDEPERKALAEALGQALGPYARPGRPILFRGDPGAEPILEAADSLPIQVADVFCHLLDRRIVGSGWLDAPKPRRPEAPRVVFATLKGGVGRSTALTVTAADFARRNRNVLVVDLDLEAPGLGNLLLDNDGTPEFGVIDYLVEDGIGGVADSDLRSYVASSKIDRTGWRTCRCPPGSRSPFTSSSGETSCRSYRGR